MLNSKSQTSLMCAQQGFALHMFYNLLKQPTLWEHSFKYLSLWGTFLIQATTHSIGTRMCARVCIWMVVYVDMHIHEANAEKLFPRL